MGLANVQSVAIWPGEAKPGSFHPATSELSPGKLLSSSQLYLGSQVKRPGNNPVIEWWPQGLAGLP